MGAVGMAELVRRVPVDRRPVGSDPVRVSEAIAVLGGSALLAGSWVVALAKQRVPEREAKVFAAVNGLPDAWWPLVWVPMQAGSVAGSLGVVGVIAVRSRDRRLSIAALAGYWVAKGRQGHGVAGSTVGPHPVDPRPGEGDGVRLRLRS